MQQLLLASGLAKDEQSQTVQVSDRYVPKDPAHVIDRACVPAVGAGAFNQEGAPLPREMPMHDLVLAGR
jgi:hypothetical protein